MANLFRLQQFLERKTTRNSRRHRSGNSNYGLNGGIFYFVKMSTLSYSLNGKENLVAPNGSYGLTDNTTVAANMGTNFKGTSMAILSGVNGRHETTNYGNALNNDVFTGWEPALSAMASDTLSLSGMSKIPGQQSDIYCLSLSYVPSISVNSNLVQGGRFGL